MTVLPFSRFRAPRLLRDPHDKTAMTLTHTDTNALPATLRLAPTLFYTTIARFARGALARSAARKAGGYLKKVGEWKKLGREGVGVPMRERLGSFVMRTEKQTRRNEASEWQNCQASSHVGIPAPDRCEPLFRELRRLVLDPSRGIDQCTCRRRIRLSHNDGQSSISARQNRLV